MIRRTGSTSACASSGSSASISAVEPLRSANNAVMILRSPLRLSWAADSLPTPSPVVNVDGPTDAGVVKGVPQSPQNCSFARLEAPHLGHATGIGTPQAAQNFRPSRLSLPHL